VACPLCVLQVLLWECHAFQRLVPGNTKTQRLAWCDSIERRMRRAGTRVVYREPFPFAHHVPLMTRVIQSVNAKGRYDPQAGDHGR
jgi:hypothetical protein